MKYSETKGEWIYDWPTIIDDLEANLYALAGQLECVTAAESWVTCACGNQCDALKRISTGEPHDDALTHLGMQFTVDILQLVRGVEIMRATHAKSARSTLAAIERRSAKILSAEIDDTNGDWRR